ncbi:MAG TPA: hypothetical protein VI756_27365 [Blastocatellia bacterium]
MLIAKVVKSNSHVDYVGRVLDKLEAEKPPVPDQYRFGQFVSIRSAGSTNGGHPDDDSFDSVGIIYNSLLVNPDYDRLGPRLSAPPEITTVFSPDLLNEQGVLIGVLLVGWRDKDGMLHQGIPRTVIPANSDIMTLSEALVRSFHLDKSGKLALHYYPHVMTHAGQFAQQLLLGVLDQLEEVSGDVSVAEVALLRRTLNWQLVFQSKSL